MRLKKRVSLHWSSMFRDSSVCRANHPRLLRGVLLWLIGYLETSQGEDDVTVSTLPLALVEEPLGDPTCPLLCEPLAMVGFPIENHEQECLALVLRIEADRFVKKEKVGSRRLPASGIKGSRELRSVVSFMNYYGRQPMVRSLWGNSNVDWEFLPAVDSAGGVLLLWDKRVLEKLDSIVNQFSVSCLWKGVFDGLEWVGTGIYSPTDDLLHRNLWEELSSVHQT
uniref:Reverse transcriptase zinc-binding domain-containing protein n=1 Tax=Fagus sylvatica TaxID=28930 RepID=A0A2N9I810_FAGSY